MTVITGDEPVAPDPDSAKWMSVYSDDATNRARLKSEVDPGSGSGLPTGGNVGDVVTNTGPGEGEWAPASFVGSVPPQPIDPDVAYDGVAIVTAVTPPTSGTFTLVYGGDETAPIPFDVVAPDAVPYLEALPSIGVGNITYFIPYATATLSTDGLVFIFAGGLQLTVVGDITIGVDNTDGGIAALMYTNGSETTPKARRGQTYLYDDPNGPIGLELTSHGTQFAAQWTPVFLATGAVDSVNGQTGNVVLDASDVGADAAGAAAAAIVTAEAYADGLDASDVGADAAGAAAAAIVTAEAYADGVARQSGVVATNAARVPLQGLALWLDGADRASITLDGSGNVTQINDRSGNGQNFADPSNGPSIDSESLNGLDVLAFDGTNSLTNTDRHNWRFLHEGAATIFVVSMRHATGSGAAGAFLFGNGSAYGMNLRYDIAVTIHSGAIYTVDNVTPHTPTDETWHTYSIYSDPTNGTAADRWLSYMDGADLKNGNGNSGSTTTGHDSTADLILGDIPGFNAELSGGIAEVLIYDRLLTDAERVQVETYLDRKWFGSETVGYVAPGSITTAQLGQALIDLGLMAAS